MPPKFKVSEKKDSVFHSVLRNREGGRGRWSREVQAHASIQPHHFLMESVTHVPAIHSLDKSHGVPSTHLYWQFLHLKHVACRPSIGCRRLDTAAARAPFLPYKGGGTGRRGMRTRPPGALTNLHRAAERAKKKGGKGAGCTIR